MRGHVAIITETKSTYVMIESTLRFDDVEDIPGLLPLLQAVQRSTATAGCIKWTIIVSGAICTPYMDWSGTGLCNSLQALLAYYT